MEYVSMIFVQGQERYISQNRSVKEMEADVETFAISINQNVKNTSKSTTKKENIRCLICGTLGHSARNGGAPNNKHLSDNG